MIEEAFYSWDFKILLTWKYQEMHKLNILLAELLIFGQVPIEHGPVWKLCDDFVLEKTVFAKFGDFSASKF